MTGAEGVRAEPEDHDAEVLAAREAGFDAGFQQAVVRCRVIAAQALIAADMRFRIAWDVYKDRQIADGFPEYDPDDPVYQRVMRDFAAMDAHAVSLRNFRALADKLEVLNKQPRTEPAS